MAGSSHFLDVRRRPEMDILYTYYTHAQWAVEYLGVKMNASDKKPTKNRSAQRKDVTKPIARKRRKLAGRPLDDMLNEHEREAFYDHSSDRAMAIILGTIVENRLTELLRLLMLRDKGLADELFNPSGPLGPFGTKVRLAYMLRIIAPETYKDLIAVNKIRNKFAHDLSVKSFEDQQITAWIQNMHIYGIVKKMGEEAKERMKSGIGTGPNDHVADFIKSNALLSSKDSYRDCIRYIIHMLGDHVDAIKAHEAEMNSAKHEAPPPKS